MKLKNPFVLTGYKGPEYFCDRVAETERLCKLIRNESNVTLLAPRRYGKTGLIHNAFNVLAREDGYETVYLDIFGTRNLAEFTQMLAQAVLGRLDTPLEKLGGAARKLVTGLRPTLTYDGKSGQPELSFTVDDRSGPATLEQIFAYLKSHDRRLVIAIDEFQQIREYPEKNVEAVIRSQVQFVACQFIFAGSKQHIMRDMFTSPQRPFYQSTTMMPLDIIAEEPYYLFASAFFKKVHLQFAREVFHHLYERFEGITWYLQAILWDLYAVGTDVVSCDQVESAVSERVLANEYDEQQILTLLPDGAKRLMRAIAAEGVVKSPQAGDFIQKYNLRAASSVKTSLKMLVDKEIVYSSSQGYVIYDRLLRDYLRRNAFS